MNKKQLLCWWVGNAFFVDRKCVGTKEGNECGKWSCSCSGIFREATTTTPISEWAEKNNIRLFWRSNLKEISCCN